MAGILGVFLWLSGGSASTSASELSWKLWPAPAGLTIGFDPVTDHVVGFGAPGTWVRSMHADSAWRHVSTPGPPSVTALLWVLDPVRRRLIATGGGLGANFWAFDMGTETWRSLPITGFDLGTGQEQVFYEPRQDRLIVTEQGVQSPIYDRYWQITLSDTLRASRLVPIGATPQPRPRAQIALDTLRSRLLLRGGGICEGMTNCNTWYTDLWALSLADLGWTQLTPNGQAMIGGLLFYDGAHDRIVGGEGMSGHLIPSGTWEQFLDPQGGYLTQALNANVGPVYDPGRDATLWISNVHAGISALSVVPLNGGSPLAIDRIAGYPNIVTNPCSIAYDPRRNRIFIYGGQYMQYPSTELWALSFSQTPTWERFTPIISPPPRAGAAMIYDPVRDRLVLYGGFKDGFEFGDTWTLDLDNPNQWHLLPVANPFISTHGPGVYDPIHDQMIVYNNNYYDLATYTLDLRNPVSWTRLTTQGAPPEWFVEGKVPLWDPVRDRWLVSSAGLYAFDPLTNAWSLVAPYSIVDVGGAYDPVDDRFLFFGGHSLAGGDFHGVGAVLLSDGTVEQPVSSIVNAGPSLNWKSVVGYDRTADRFVADGGWWTLERGTPLVFDVQVTPAPLTSGQVTPIQTHVTNPYPREMSWAVYARPGRNWPVSHTRTRIPGNSTVAVTVGVAVPDTASAGTTSFVFEGRPEGGAGGSETASDLTVVAGGPPPPPGTPGFSWSVVNPTRDAITFSITVSLQQEGTAEVFDLNGRTIARIPLGSLSPGTHPFQFSVPSVPAGLYWLRVTVGGSNETRRIALLR